MALNRRSFLITLVIVAFLVRLGAVVLLRDPNVGPGRQLGADGLDYNTFALQLARGHGYTWANGQATSFRAPGFPLFLAVIFHIWGQRYIPVYLVFCLVGALTSLFAYLLARELASEKIARTTAIISAFYLPAVYFSTEFASENLFALCLGAGTWLFVRYLRARSPLDLAMAGAILGWAALTRAFALLLLPLLLVVLIIDRTQKWQYRLITLAGFAIVFSGVIMPWTLRNYAVHGRFVLIATNGGSTFYGGNNDIVAHQPYYLGTWISTKHLPGRDLIDAEPDEVSHDKQEWRLGMQWVKTHPLWMTILCVLKFIRLWLPDIQSGNRTYVILQLFCTTPILFLVLLGLFQSLRNREFRGSSWLALHATTLTMVLTGLVFWGAPRFRDANAAPLMVYAAIGMYCVTKWVGCLHAYSSFTIWRNRMVSSYAKQFIQLLGEYSNDIADYGVHAGAESEPSRAE